MDLTPFKKDIDELMDEFIESNFTTLADMKRVWLAKKFSYIYEGKPPTGSGTFMQSLFAYSISHMVSTGGISRRLGGLYCLYCLYETQPYKPYFRIYLSLAELKKLKTLVTEAKENGIGILPALVKRMLAKNIFLFGSVDVEAGSVTHRVDEFIKLQNKRVQIAHEKLLANTGIEDYLHADLGAEMEIEGLKKLSTEYEKAKEQAMKEASHKVQVEDLKQVLENKEPIGKMAEDIVEEWNAQKKAFYKQTGICQGNEIVTYNNFGNEIVTFDNFEEELEDLLSE